MTILRFTCTVNAPHAAVAEYHSTVDTLFRLTPPSMHARLEGNAVPMAEGAVYHIVTKQFGFLPIHLHSQITKFDLPRGFQDCQLPGRGPFRSWCHTHEFSGIDAGSTLITDTVAYDLPFGILGQFVDVLFVRRQISVLFNYRYKVTREDLDRT